MDTYVVFKYQSTSSQDLADFKVEPGSGTHIPQEGEVITLKVDDKEGQYEVTERYHVYTGANGRIRNQYIIVVVNDHDGATADVR